MYLNRVGVMENSQCRSRYEFFQLWAKATLPNFCEALVSTDWNNPWRTVMLTHGPVQSPLLRWFRQQYWTLITGLYWLTCWGKIFYKLLIKPKILSFALGHVSSDSFVPLCQVLNLSGTEKQNYGEDVTGGLKTWLTALGETVRRLLELNIRS